MIKQTNECTYFDIDEVYEAIKMFETNLVALAESGRFVDNGDIVGSWDIISEKNNPEMTLITEVVIYD